MHRLCWHVISVIVFSLLQSRIAENLRNPRTRCRVADIQVLENLDLKKVSILNRVQLLSFDHAKKVRDSVWILIRMFIK